MEAIVQNKEWIRKMEDGRANFDKRGWSTSLDSEKQRGNFTLFLVYSLFVK